MNFKNNIFKSLSYAFLAQGISLLMSLLVSLILPKLLGIEEFSYWQLFIFYCSYIPLFHFGLNDGVYLKYGGINYDDMNNSSIKSQFCFGQFYQIIISISIIIFAIIFVTDNNRLFTLVLSCIYFLTFSAGNFLGYLFQAANDTKSFSISVIISRIAFIIGIPILLVLHINNYRIFAIAYTLSYFLSLLYCLIKAKDILKHKLLKLNQTIIEALDSISCGIKLMLSNIASMLIIGVGRIISDNVWGIFAFGRVSFSITLTNFILTFISQISMVLFPTLRQVNEKEQNSLYILLNNILNLILPIVYIGYIPIKILLSYWLPQYIDSIQYLDLLLPLCIFDGKMQLLCNTYLKVLRKEKILLKINSITLMISAMLSLIGGYIIQNINFIIISMVITIGLRSIFAEIYLAARIKVKVIKNIIQEIVFAITFMLLSRFFSICEALIFLSFIYSIFLIINRRDLMILIKRSKCILTN